MREQRLAVGGVDVGGLRGGHDAELLGHARRRASAPALTPSPPTAASGIGEAATTTPAMSPARRRGASRPAAAERALHHHISKVWTKPLTIRESERGPNVSPGTPSADRGVRHAERGDESTTICATTATPRSAPGWSTSRSTCARQPLPAWLADPIAGVADRPGALPGRHRGTARGRRPARPRRRRGAAHRRRRPGVRAARPGPARRAPAVVVHPQFTEPEAALRDAGHPVERVLLRAADGFRLDPDAGARRRRPGLHRQPHQPDLGAAPGRRRWPRWPGPAGCWWSTRRSPTPRTPRRAGEPESLAGRARPARPGRAAQPDQDLGAGRAADRLPARRRPTWSPGWPPCSRCGPVSTPALAAAVGLRVAARGRRRAARSPRDLAADRDAPGAPACGPCRASRSPAARPARSCCCAWPARDQVRLALRGARLGGAPRRHVPRAGPRLAAGRGARHCHHRRVRRRRCGDVIKERQ